MYRDEMVVDGSIVPLLVIRVSISDVAFLHELRDTVLEAHKEWNEAPQKVEGVRNERAGWMYVRHGKWDDTERSVCRCGEATPDVGH